MMSQTELLSLIFFFFFFSFFELVTQCEKALIVLELVTRDF